MFENFKKQQLGEIREVIIEELVDDFYIGHSKNYIKVYIKKGNQTDLINEVENVKVQAIFKDGVLGIII